MLNYMLSQKRSEEISMNKLIHNNSGNLQREKGSTKERDIYYI